MSIWLIFFSESKVTLSQIWWTGRADQTGEHQLCITPTKTWGVRWNNDRLCASGVCGYGLTSGSKVKVKGSQKTFWAVTGFLQKCLAFIRLQVCGSVVHYSPLILLEPTLITLLKKSRKRISQLLLKQTLDLLRYSHHHHSCLFLLLSLSFFF